MDQFVPRVYRMADPETEGRLRTRQSDAEVALIQRLQSGDEHAVADLALTHGSQIFRIALRCLRNHEDAEELTQDVLLVVSRRIHAFRQDAALGSWIHRITFNAAMSRLRRTRRRRQVEVGGLSPGSLDPGGPAIVPDPADETPAADAVLMLRERLAQLEAAMRALPAAVRRCIVVRDLECRSTHAASELLQVKAETVKSRIHRGRLLLRKRLSLPDGKLAYTGALSPP